MGIRRRNLSSEGGSDVLRNGLGLNIDMAGDFFFLSKGTVPRHIKWSAEARKRGLEAGI